MKHDRRSFLRNLARGAGSAAALSALPPAIQRALAIPANRRTGTIQDVEHIVILTQENRSFDHYFGCYNGVRGFADPFPVPAPTTPVIWNKNVWVQPNQTVVLPPPAITPFRLNTQQNFDYMRVTGTAHSWSDAQLAWDHGRMNNWTFVKGNHSMGHFEQDDIPFQYALADAFTLCDAYHCSTQTGTNTNRLFVFTGTNDPLGKGNGPATYNDYDTFDANPGNDGGYSWTTFPERLEAAGISWQVYQNMADNFTDNPLAGFHSFRDAWFQRPGYSQSLRDRGVSTRDLDKLKDDVLADRLPQVSWIVATAEGSEHPGPSSPAQGADYTARVLDSLTANPDVWAKTVLFINFDENDGFFDHMPPPAVPSYEQWNADPAKAKLAGASTVDTTGEYHEILKSYHNDLTEQTLLHRPYGLGPRVPLYVVSPWSKGGWVNSQVHDHTSVIRFVEKRFGVFEPNISAWRRAVCGDLTSVFNFAEPDDDAFFARLPATLSRAEQARAIKTQPLPVIPPSVTLPEQLAGPRPSRALPYELSVNGAIKASATTMTLSFVNTGAAAAVFHVYDQLNLLALPRRYTVEPGKQLSGTWGPSVIGTYDLWVLGPNGFHRQFSGNTWTAVSTLTTPEVTMTYDPANSQIVVTLKNSGLRACTFVLQANRYANFAPIERTVGGKSQAVLRLDVSATGHWYDFSATVKGQDDYLRRFAGRMETGAASISDPAMHSLPVIDR